MVLLVDVFINWFVEVYERVYCEKVSVVKYYNKLCEEEIVNDVIRE